MSKSNIGMLLFEDLQEFVTENTRQLIFMVFLTILAYGYFITNWSISIDSELASFKPLSTSSIVSLHQGRFALYILNLLTNHHIIPFWNDFISVVFIFSSALVWCVSLRKINANYHGLIIFSLIYIISPIYAFYLRFTTYNISISVALLFNSIALYCFVHFLIALEQNSRQKLNFCLCTFLIFLTVSIYEVFATYWITSVLLISSYWIVSKETTRNYSYLKKWFKQNSYGILCVLIALILNRICLQVINHFIDRSQYTNKFISWGKEDLVGISYNLYNYFKSMIFGQGYNFFITVTLISTIVFYVYLLKRSLRNLPMIFLLGIFVFSAFLMCFVLGFAMPLRTLQSIPLMLAGTWLIIYVSVGNKIIQKGIYAIVLISTLLNAHYITRLFYGDNMRFQYDVNYANQLYGFVIGKVGDAINYKPLVIAGSHYYAVKPFIIKSSETIGFSFFECGVDCYKRIPVFMSWLGNDYIVPNKQQLLAGEMIANDMTDFPDKASIKETDELIILRLSQPLMAANKAAIKLDLDQFKLINSDLVPVSIDVFENTLDKIKFTGWTYYKMKNNEHTRKYIKLTSDKESYIYKANTMIRYDVAQAFNDGGNLKFAGFDITLDKKNLQPGSYRISLLVTNGTNLAKISTSKTFVVE